MSEEKYIQYILDKWRQHISKLPPNKLTYNNASADAGLKIVKKAQRDYRKKYFKEKEITNELN